MAESHAQETARLAREAAERRAREASERTAREAREAHQRMCNGQNCSQCPPR